MMVRVLGKIHDIGAYQDDEGNIILTVRDIMYDKYMDTSTSSEKKLELAEEMKKIKQELTAFQISKICTECK